MNKSNHIQNILIETEKFFDREFENGKGLRGTPLKNYSAESLEKTSEFVLKMIVKNLSEKYPNALIEHSKDYIRPDEKHLSKERMDQHIKVNGKYVLLQEDRAWMDKPFYLLKRGVTSCIMRTCTRQLYDNVKFIYIGYCLDFKKEIVNTCDLALGHGDKVITYSITNRPRGKKINGKSVNWYETGYDKSIIKEYVETAYNIIEDAIRNVKRDNSLSGRLFG